MFGASKTPKEDKSAYILYYQPPATTSPPIGFQCGKIPDDGYIRISIDPAIKNFGIRIENRLPNDQITPLYFYRINFMEVYPDSESKPPKPGKKSKSEVARVNPQILDAVLQLFIQLFPLIRQSRLVVIERQPPFNYQSTRIFQHILTWFLMMVGQFEYPCWIYDVNSGLKGEIFGAPKGLTYTQLKEWDIETALAVLAQRGDQESINVIRHHRGKTKTKSDDLADTVIQVEALVIRLGGRSICYPASLEILGT